MFPFGSGFSNSQLGESSSGAGPLSQSGRPRRRWIIVAALSLLVAGTALGARQLLISRQPPPAFGPEDPALRAEWVIGRRSQLLTMTPAWVIERCGYPDTNKLREEDSRVGKVPQRTMSYRAADGSSQQLSFLSIEGHWMAPSISSAANTPNGINEIYPLKSEADLARVFALLPCLAK
jgi:hypothetical protein